MGDSQHHDRLPTQEEDGAPERKGGESGKESGKEGKGKRGNVDGPQKDDQVQWRYPTCSCPDVGA